MRPVRALLAVFAVACGGDAGGRDGLSRAELVEACARIGACRSGAAAAVPVTRCAERTPTELAALPRSFRDAVRCANRAGGDCDAILACFSGGEPTACDLAAPPRCLDEARQWQCLAGLALVTDCTADGLACVVPAGGFPRCARATCEPTTPPSCDEGRVLECREGALVPSPCPDGAACGVAAGAAQCVGKGAPCPPGTAPACEGATTLVTCIGGAEARQACDAGGYLRVCRAADPLVPGDVGRCAGADDECDPASFVDRCNGGRLEFCEDGRVRGVDCRALGFQGCAPGAGAGPSRCLGPAPTDAGVPDAEPPPEFDAAP